MAEMAEEGDDDDDDDDDRSPSAGSAASLELYHSVRGLIPDGHVRDKDQISMKSDCATGLRRRLSIINAQQHKVGPCSAICDNDNENVNVNHNESHTPLDQRFICAIGTRIL